MLFVSPQLADLGAIFAYSWAGLMFATGMTSNIDIDIAAVAEALWTRIDAVTEGLGGGNELIGGLWILLVSLAAWEAADCRPASTCWASASPPPDSSRSSPACPMSVWCLGSAPLRGSLGPASSCSAALRRLRLRRWPDDRRDCERRKRTHGRPTPRCGRVR